MGRLQESDVSPASPWEKMLGQVRGETASLNAEEIIERYIEAMAQCDVLTQKKAAGEDMSPAAYEQAQNRKLALALIVKDASGTLPDDDLVDKIAQKRGTPA
jgi:hypothetical protein